MSSPIVTTLFAKNEFSASAVTTHSAFLLSDGQQIMRQFDFPQGWTKLRLTFKAALYNTNGTYQSNLTSTRFAVGLCSSGRGIGITSSAHFIGTSWGFDSFALGTWNVNGQPAAGEPSGAFNTPLTSPPGAAHYWGPYVMRPVAFATGSLIMQGNGASGQGLPLYNVNWSSSYTSSLNYPFYKLAGFGWEVISIDFLKNKPLEGTSVAVGIGQIPKSAFSVIAVTDTNRGINVPRPIVRRASMIDEGPGAVTVFHDHNVWATWWKDLTHDDSVFTHAATYGNVGSVSEAAYGPLNCVNFHWNTAESTMKLAIRDVAIVIESASLSPSAPLLLSASHSGSSPNMLLNWRYNAFGQDGFYIYRSTDGITYTGLATSSYDSTTYTDSNITGGVNYSYKVRAFTANSFSEYSNTSSFLSASIAPNLPQFGTLIRWFDADSYSATKVNNDALSSTDTWFDYSSNATPATPVNTAKPIFKTNIYGTLPAVFFTSPFARMNHPSDITFAGDFTFVIVASGSQDTILLGQAGINQQLRIVRSGVNRNSFFPNSGTELSSSLLGTPIGRSKANVWIRSGGVVTFWENSASFGSGSNSGTFITNIIGNDDGGPLNTCYVGNILMYSTAMSDAQYSILYNEYLKPRFGLP